MANNDQPSEQNAVPPVRGLDEQPPQQPVEQPTRFETVPYAKLGIISFGLAMGFTSAIFIFFLGIMATFFEWGLVLAATLSSFLIGYGPTFVGTIAGTVWAFVVGFIFGLLIAWFYNRLLFKRLGRPLL